MRRSISDGINDGLSQITSVAKKIHSRTLMSGLFNSKIIQSPKEKAAELNHQRSLLNYQSYLEVFANCFDGYVTDTSYNNVIKIQMIQIVHGIYLQIIIHLLEQLELPMLVLFVHMVMILVLQIIYGIHLVHGKFGRHIGYLHIVIMWVDMHMKSIFMTIFAQIQLQNLQHFVFIAQFIVLPMVMVLQEEEDYEVVMIVIHKSIYPNLYLLVQIIHRWIKFVHSHVMMEVV